ncbi:MAG: DUF2157 domain-containing protein [Patescibacteria group bacterium]
MNKDELLRELALKISTGEINREEVTRSLGGSAAADLGEPATPAPHIGLTKWFYWLGGIIAIVGIILFVGQFWDDLGSAARIIVTLGFGLILAATGSMLLKQKPNQMIGSIFHTLGGLLIPGGTMVLLYELDVDLSTLWPITISFGLIFVFYLALAAAHKRPILTFFAVANGTTFVYLLIESLIEGRAYEHENLYAYLTMIVGITYLLLAQQFSRGWNKQLAGLFNFFGSAGFLAAAGSRIPDSVPWQLIYVLFVLAMLFWSIRAKSRGILAVSTIALLAYIGFITQEYFVDSIGWPIALIILGFVFIGLGYASINISKKYIQAAN